MDIPDSTSSCDSSDVSQTTLDDTSAEASSAEEAPMKKFNSPRSGTHATTALDDVHLWRPRHHLMAPHGWMNDPCAPGFDEKAGCYHLNFQWNPHGSSWGNISWGSALSDDLVHWTTCEVPAMAPSRLRDTCGIFTGCKLPPAKSLEVGELTAFYTSARKLPISYKEPYYPGCEQLALAKSQDSGRTWERAEDNIILTNPPSGFDVTGWRDPFVGPWPALDEIMGGVERLYGIISGGLRGQTPTVFLYLIDPLQPTIWVFLGPLIDVGLNFSPSRWSMDFGVNWEVANFLTLSDDTGAPHQVLIVSAEGTLPTSADPTARDVDYGVLSRDHRQMWLCGSMTLDKEAPKMIYQHGGALDHGSFYAANGFRDPRTGQYVLWGWIFEEDLSQSLIHRQKWSGCLSLPRVVAMRTWRGVLATGRSPLTALTCFQTTPEADGTHTLRTVCALPDPRLRSLRSRLLAPVNHDSGFPFPSPLQFTFPRGCAQWELNAAFRVGRHAQRLGVDILHLGDGSQYTRISYMPHTETLEVDRSQSTLDGNVNTGPKTAPHVLFTVATSESGQGVGDGGPRGTQEGAASLSREDLVLHIFFDASVLEIFANERVVLTTRVYPESGTCFGLRVFVDEQSGTIESDGGDATEGESHSSSFVRRSDLWQLSRYDSVRVSQSTSE